MGIFDKFKKGKEQYLTEYVSREEDFQHIWKCIVSARETAKDGTMNSVTCMLDGCSNLVLNPPSPIDLQIIDYLYEKHFCGSKKPFSWKCTVHSTNIIEKVKSNVSKKNLQNILKKADQYLDVFNAGGPK